MHDRGMSATPASGADTVARGDQAAASGRIVAIDLARWIAIVGMMAAHLLVPVTSSSLRGPDLQGRLADIVTGAANGNSSSLFAVLTGASLVLATRSMLRRGQRAAALRSVLGRAIVVGAVGVLLAAAMPPVYVVLNFLAAAMVLAAPLLLLPSWAVAAIAAPILVGGSQLAIVVRDWRFDTSGGALRDALEGSPLAAVADLLFTGQYPAVTWVPLLAVGIVVTRALLAASDRRRARALGLGMLAVGVVLVVVTVIVSQRVLDAFAEPWAAERGLVDALPMLLDIGSGTPPDGSWWWQATAVPHSGTIGSMLRGTGVALAVLGALVVALPPGSTLPRVLRPVGGAGSAPFTTYALHVWALLVASALWGAIAGDSPTPPWYVAGFAILGIHVLGSLLLGAWLARTDAKGPLERVASAVARSFARLPADATATR